MMTILAVRADWVGAKLVTEAHAGIRRAAFVTGGQRQWGRLGDQDLSGSVTEQSDQPPAGHLPLLLFIHQLCTPKLLSQDVLKCLSASYCYFLHVIRSL